MYQTFIFFILISFTITVSNALTLSVDPSYEIQNISQTKTDYQYDSFIVNSNLTCVSMLNGPGNCEYKLGEVCDFYSEWLINYVEKSDDDDDDDCTGTEVCTD